LIEAMPYSNSTIDFLHQRLQEDLPGDASHFKMLPFKRESIQSVFDKGIKYRESAVAVVFYEKDEALHVLLMERPVYEGVHSGQISFPGGKREEDDLDLEFTARREFTEESGVESASFELIGELSQVFIPPSGFIVNPYVFYTPTLTDFAPDQREVASLIEMPLDLLLDEATIKTTEMHFKSHDTTITTPYFDVFGHVVWGATCAMLSELKDVLQERLEQ